VEQEAFVTTSIKARIFAASAPFAITGFLAVAPPTPARAQAEPCASEHEDELSAMREWQRLSHEQTELEILQKELGTMERDLRRTTPQDVAGKRAEFTSELRSVDRQLAVWTEEIWNQTHVSKDDLLLRKQELQAGLALLDTIERQGAGPEYMAWQDNPVIMRGRDASYAARQKGEEVKAAYREYTAAYRRWKACYEQAQADSERQASAGPAAAAGASPGCVPSAPGEGEAGHHHHGDDQATASASPGGASPSPGESPPPPTPTDGAASGPPESPPGPAIEPTTPTTTTTASADPMAGVMLGQWRDTATGRVVEVIPRNYGGVPFTALDEGRPENEGGGRSPLTVDGDRVRAEKWGLSGEFLDPDKRRIRWHGGFFDVGAEHLWVKQ
jgi:hypothetical protein